MFSAIEWIRRIQQTLQTMSWKSDSRRSRSTAPLVVTESMEQRLLLTADFGDAPDSNPGTSVGNYQTQLTDDGPSHNIDATQTALFLGVTVDGDDGTLQNAESNADDVGTAGPNDENGVLSPIDLKGTEGATPKVTLLVTNTAGTTASLYGWIDYNRDGVFDNETERASIDIPDGTSGERFTLVFPAIPEGAAGKTYARFRLSTDSAAADSTGPASDGEVEDYGFEITVPSEGLVARYSVIKGGTNGAPAIPWHDGFSKALANMGDIDGDGVADIAVGSPWDSTTGEHRGAVRVLSMNEDGSVKSSSKIADSIGGGPALTDTSYFGSSVSAIGDLDGNGVSELAVGAPNMWRYGKVFVLFMNADGTASRSTELTSGINGIPVLHGFRSFGTSVAAIGDLNGDSIPDLAIGDSEDTGSNFNAGAVYICMMNADGTVKESVRIANGVNGGPVLPQYEYFGTAVALVGDVDGDGISDIAVGAVGENGATGYRSGAVFVLMMTTEGKVRTSIKIANSTNGGPALKGGQQLGTSLTSLGDLDGDGIPDLGVGVERPPITTTYKGGLFVFLLNSNGSVKKSRFISEGTSNGPLLSSHERFGISAASLGDLNGDGFVEIAVGAFPGHQGTGPSMGGIYILSLDAPDLTGPTLTVTPNAGVTNARTVLFTFQFSEPVTGFSKGDIQVKNATSGEFTAVDADTYTLLVTPNSSSPLTVDVPENAVTDPSGNFNNPVHVSMIQDRLSPSVDFSIKSEVEYQSTNSDRIPLILTFNEPVTGFTQDDLNLVNLEVDSIEVLSDRQYQVNLKPLSDGHVSVRLNSGAVQDIAGNPSNQGQWSGTSDRKAPVLISIKRGNPISEQTSANNLTFVVTFSESPQFVDADDFVALGTTASIGVYPKSATEYLITLTGGDLFAANGRISVALSSAMNICDFAGNKLVTELPSMYETYLAVHPPDLGDAPDNGPGTSRGNYQTNPADGGPTHFVSQDLKLGSRVDGEFNAQQNGSASGDDRNGTGLDDEDGVRYDSDLSFAFGVAPQIRLPILNSTSKPAVLAGWIDFNADGVFDLSERVTKTIEPSSLGQFVTLSFSQEFPGFTGNTFARFRIGDDPAFMQNPSPIGAGGVGEVEDYAFSITRPAGDSFQIRSAQKIANGISGLSGLAAGSYFGVSVADAGDLDGDGVGDLIVGAPGDDTGAVDAGAVHLLLMNANGTVKKSTKIASGASSGLLLAANEDFGISVAGIGDVNKDGVPDLAVGALVSGGNYRGAVYVLFSDGTGGVRSSTKIADGSYGEPGLQDWASFGSSITAIAPRINSEHQRFLVGAFSDNSGKGAIYDIEVNSTGKISSATRITDGENGGPTLAVDDAFGSAVASVGDIDGDGITDLAVGAFFDDTGGTDRGAVYVLLMNTDSTVKRYTKIASNTGGGPSLKNDDIFGSSITGLGDLDGNGVPDFAVGAANDDTGGIDRGAVYIVYMKADGTVKRYEKLASGSPGLPGLKDSNYFGSGLASLHDFNSDGITDIAVGIQGDGVSNTDLGAVHLLNLKGPEPASGTPVIRTPNNLITIDRRFTLKWDAVAGADGYEVYYTSVATNAAGYIRHVVTTNSFTPSSDLPIGGYNIWVRVKQLDRTASPWSKPVAVRVSTIPAFNEVQSGQTGQQPVLSWSPVAGAVRYEVWINNLTTGRTKVFWDDKITATSLTASQLTGFGNQRAWVRAYDAAGVSSAWSAAKEFVIGPQPIGPIQPTFERRPTFVWTKVEGAATYQLYLATSAGVVIHSNLTEASFTPTTDLPTGLISWWVRGTSASGWTGAWSIRAVTNIGGQTSLTVVRNSAPDSGLLFQWQGVTGASRFILIIQASDGKVIYRDESLTETQFLPKFQFDPGSYRVWVKAISSSDNSSGIWSNKASFVIAKIDDDSMIPEETHGKEITILRTRLAFLQPQIPSNQGTVIAESKRLPDQNSEGFRTNEDAGDHRLDTAADSDATPDHTPSATDLIMSQFNELLAVTIP